MDENQERIRELNRLMQQKAEKWQPKPTKRQCDHQECDERETRGRKHIRYYHSSVAYRPKGK